MFVNFVEFIVELGQSVMKIAPPAPICEIVAL
jgi:hypothetical protein